jgi:phosphohistidine swiveling domain-containing protein
MTVFSKIFTRDFPVILCQVWGRRYKELFEEEVPAYPRNVFVFKDGLVETYRNPAANPAMNGIILARIAQEPDFIPRTVKGYAPKIQTLKAYCSKSAFTKQEFADFLDLLLDCWQVLYIGMYVPSDERFSVEDREHAMAFRTANDRVEYEAFAAVNIALKNVFPDQARAQDRLIVVDDEVVSEADFEALQKKYDFSLEPETEVSDVQEIKGQVACAGKAQGTVRILMKHTEVASFPDGAILVSSMTVPTFLPAMKKAAAFVTDEGGITCHAAIVAREMKKPCIIGTKIATKVFKNGDRVEVDADKGIVRKI